MEDRPLGRFLGELVMGVVSGAGWLFGSGAPDVRARAEEEARASRAQQKKWLEEVSRQMARGKAGDASQKDARAALRGRGGRPSKLDDRMF